MKVYNILFILAFVFVLFNLQSAKAFHTNTLSNNLTSEVLDLSTNRGENFTIAMAESDSITAVNRTFGFAFIPLIEINLTNVTISSSNYQPSEIILRNSTRAVIARNTSTITSGFANFNILLSPGQKYYLESNYSMGSSRTISVNKSFVYSRDMFGSYINITNSSDNGYDGAFGNPYIYSVRGFGFIRASGDRTLYIPENVYLTNASMSFINSKELSFSIINTQSDSITAVNRTFGFAFIPSRNITLKNVTISSSNYQPSELLLRNSSRHIVARNTTTIVSGLANFSHILTAGQKYYIEANYSMGSSRTISTNESFVYSRDMFGSYINITNSSDNGYDGAFGNPYIYSINGLGYEVFYSSVRFYIANSLIFNQESVVNVSNRTNDFSNIINNYLTSCSFVSGYCSVPFIFSFEGSLRYFGVDIGDVGFFEENHTYNNSAYEMTTQTYNINISYNSLNYVGVTGVLYFNGTAYTGTSIGSGNNILFTRSIDVPSSGNKSLYWMFTMTNLTGTYYYNSTLKYQSILSASFSLCNSTFNYTVVNFTLYNSESITTKLNGSFYATFNYTIGGSSYKKGYSYQNNSNTESNFRFCVNPNNVNYSVDADIQFSAPSYSQNYHYYRGASLTTNITEQPLYLLNSSKGTITELRVINAYQVGQPNVIIQIQKYDVGTGSYYSVGMAKTNYDGKENIYLNWYDTFYKFIGTSETGTVLFNYDPYKIASTPQTFTTSQTNTFTYDKFDNMQYTLYYNNNTKNVVLTFIDSTGLMTSGCLKINKIAALGGGTIYDECLAATSGTITYNMGDNEGNFVATFYGTGSNGYVGSINFLIDISHEIFDTLDKKDSGVYAFLIVGGSAFLGLFSPVAAIIFGLGGWLVAGSLGFVKINTIYFVGLAIVGGYIAWKLRN